MLIYTCGCSFTHSTNSWAHCDDVNNLAIGNHSDFQKQNFILEQKHHTKTTKFPGTVEQFNAMGKKLPGAKYVNLSSGASSPAFQVLKFKKYCKSNSKPDVCIFQISSMMRKVLEVELDLTDKNKGIVNQCEQINNKWYIHFGQYLNIVDAYRKQIKNKELRQHIKPEVERFVKLDFKQVAKENFDSLVDIIHYCKNNNITLGFILGWDIIYDQEGMPYDNMLDNNKLAWSLVQEKMITQTDIISHAKQFLKPEDWYDNPTSTHPSALAHLKFWNELIFTWLEKNINK